VRDLDTRRRLERIMRARASRSPFDLGGQLDLLVGSKERDLPDLAQVNLYSSYRYLQQPYKFSSKG